MSSTIKVVLIWVLILVAASSLYHFVENSSETHMQIFDFTEFLENVQMGRVAEVTIRGQNVAGRLRENNGRFRASIPDGYSAIYDTLIVSKVKVAVIPEDRLLPGHLPWLALGLALSGAFGFGWLCCSLRGRALGKA
jgi:hypothetical protein